MINQNKTLNILQLCNKPPYPPTDGGSIAMHNISQGLIDAGHNLKILSFSTNKHHVDIEKLPQSYISQTSFEAVEIDLSIKLYDAFTNLFFTKKSYNISRFTNKKMQQKLEEVLKNNEFDIIQVESIFFKNYLPIIRKHSNAKVVLRAPNVEYIIWQRLAENEPNKIKRFYLNILAKRLKHEELSVLNKFDAICTVSENDLKIMKAFGVKVPIDFIPIGCDVTKSLITKDIEVEYPSLFHIGALDWRPNQEGIKWILENIWDKLHSEFPNIKFYVAGRKPPKWLTEINVEGVEVIGDVDDAASFIKSKAIMLAPLFSGSGMRVKIVEAMMLGKAIVTTTIGIEGIKHTDGEDVMIANTPNDFLDKIKILILNKDKYNSICKNAIVNASKNYSNEVLSKKLLDFFYEL